jgi:DNA-binding CsgD family transcriptional regulator
VPTQDDWNAWSARPVCVSVVLQQWGGTWSDLLDAARQSDAEWPTRLSRSRAVSHLLSLPDNQLTPRQRALAELFRAGHTLESAGALMGLTRGRVRQIASRAERRTIWTHEAVAIRLRAWLDAHGGIAPTMVEWGAADEEPSHKTIAKVCGSWRGA